MKKFLILRFPECGDACLEDAIIGMCDSLEEVQVNFNYYDEYQTLDMKSGDFWQWSDDDKQWTKKTFDNIMAYADLDIKISCPECKKEFTPNGKDQIFCSDKCRKKVRDREDSSRTEIRRLARQEESKWQQAPH